ncbi:MAG: hypothetical protein KC492_33115, partial [Myxococcales bacterium]|nr:hypothetical protein [Myxococcales bacterium]
MALGACSASPSPEETSSAAAALEVGSEIELDPVRSSVPIDGRAYAVSAASDGNGYLVTWCGRYQEGADTRRFAARLDSAGQLLDQPPLQLSSNSCIVSDHRGTAAVLHAPGGYLVVYEKSLEPGVGTVYDLQSTWVADDGTVGATNDLVVAPENQHYPTLASSGSEMLLVYSDKRSGAEQVYAQRLDLTGAPLGAELALTTQVPDGDRHPTVTFDGTNYFVVWTNHPNIEGIRVSPAGTLVDASPMRLAEPSGANSLRSPHVAAAGGNVLLAFEASNGVLGRLLDPSGNVLSVLTFQAGSNDAGSPRVTTDGTDFVVTWAREVFSFEDPGPVRAARVSSAGSLLDAAPGLRASQGTGQNPFAASNGSDYLVFWSGEASGSNGQLGSVSLSPAGVVGAERLLTSDLNVQARPAAAFDGTQHLVVWQSQSEGNGLDLVGTRVGAGDVPEDAPTIPLITASGDQHDVALARGNGSYLMSWTDDATSKVRCVRVDD